jgi:hypothetical protein
VVAVLATVEDLVVVAVAEDRAETEVVLVAVEHAVPVRVSLGVARPAGIEPVPPLPPVVDAVAVGVPLARIAAAGQLVLVAQAVAVAVRAGEADGGLERRDPRHLDAGVGGARGRARGAPGRVVAATAVPAAVAP